jgi:hypothetical protein
MIFITTTVAAFPKGDDLLKVRKYYYLAIKSEEKFKEFENILVKYNNPENTILGYIGMSFMLKAKYAWLPNYKLEYFTKGKNFLESAISKDPNNVELKFMRFCVQNETPSFLSYKINFIKDKNFLIKSFPHIKDNDLKQKICSYMLENKIELTDIELSRLNKQ